MCIRSQAGNADEFPLRQKEGGELASIDRPGVDTYFVNSDQGLGQGGMVKYNGLTEIQRGAQKLFPCPEAPLRCLLAEMASGLQSGVNVNGMLVLPIERQTAEE